MAGPARVSLLCLPCAGASATMYLRWRPLLPRWIEVVPVELPGRGMRMGERFVEAYDALVERICTEQAVAMQGGFAIFGHSMGALLAYGVAQRLRSLGRPLPLALFASGSSAPSQRDPDRLPDTHDDAALTADLRRQGGTPEEVFASDELMRITLDTLGADYRVCRSFEYVSADTPLPMPLHVLAGRQDDIDAARVEAWSAHAGGAFSLDWFDGGHFFIRQHEAAVLAALVRRLGLSVAGGRHASHAVA
ncbi:thioesterase II family protein [Variovorax atrisoli]|uniref:thioesterase II family protein n=1 Tax=Variovorax atrisoli TaxID=3394203 RepID=UPI003391564F